MALKGPRRPNTLILQAHGNLRSQAAAKQAELQGTFPVSRARSSGGNRPGSSSNSKPPHLPGSGYPPPRSPSAGALPELPDVLGSSHGSIRSGTCRSGVAASSPSNKRGGKQPHRSGSLDASESLRRSTPPAQRSPSSSSQSGRVSPRRPPSAFDQAVAEAVAAAEEAADADMDDQFAVLDELSSFLGLKVDDSAASDGRPTSCGTAASASTAAPRSSKGEAASSLGDAEEGHCEGGKESSRDFHQTLKGVPRLQRELQQCRLPHGCRIETSQVSAAQFFFIMDVAEGPYTPATVTFWVKVFEDFPAPGSCSIRATKRIFHPCIDPTTGAVEVPNEASLGNDSALLRNLLLALREIIVNPPDAPAVNGDAAMLLQTDRDEFRRVVRLTLNGGEHAGAKFERVLNPSSLGRSAGKDKERASSPGSKPVSEKVRVDFMQLESMKEKFKLQATEWQQQNMDDMDREC